MSPELLLSGCVPWLDTPPRISNADCEIVLQPAPTVPTLAQRKRLRHWSLNSRIPTSTLLSQLRASLACCLGHLSSTSTILHADQAWHSITTEPISMWSELVSCAESKQCYSCNCIQKVTPLTNARSHTYTYSGAVGLTGATFCYGLFGGTYCEAPTQLNVPISFIQQTSAK